MKASYLFLLLAVISYSVGAEILTFDQALQKIIGRDTSLPVKEAQLYSSSSNRLAKIASFFPTLEVGHRHTKDLNTESRGSTDYISSNLNLFKSGADLFSLRAAGFQLQRNQQGFSDLLLQREELALSTLLDLILNIKAATIQQEMVELKQSAFNLIKTKYDKGLSSSDDMMKAQVDLKNAQATYRSATIALNRAQSALKALLGEENTVEDKWPWRDRLRQINSATWPNGRVGGRAVDDHPRVKEAFFYFQEEASNRSYYRSLLLPRIDFSWSWSWSQHKLLTQQQNEQVGVLTFSWALFDGLTGWSSYQAQNSNMVAAHYGHLQRKRDVEAKMEEIGKNLLIAQSTAIEREETLLLSQKLYDKNFQRYRQGKISLNDLEWEQERLLRSKNLANEGQAQLHLMWVNFCHIRGYTVEKCKI